jgi:hypothetical protein
MMRIAAMIPPYRVETGMGETVEGSGALRGLSKVVIMF